jgi:hypothetical protein
MSRICSGDAARTILQHFPSHTGEQIMSRIGSGEPPRKIGQHFPLRAGEKLCHETGPGMLREKSCSISSYALVKHYVTKRVRGCCAKNPAAFPPTLANIYLTKRPGGAAVKKRTAFPTLFRSNHTVTKRVRGRRRKKTDSISPYALVKNYLTKRPGGGRVMAGVMAG